MPGPVRVVMVLPCAWSWSIVPGMVLFPWYRVSVPVPGPGKGEAIVRVYGACAWYSPLFQVEHGKVVLGL